MFAIDFVASVGFFVGVSSVGGVTDIAVADLKTFGDLNDADTHLGFVESVVLDTF